MYKNLWKYPCSENSHPVFPKQYLNRFFRNISSQIPRERASGFFQLFFHEYNQRHFRRFFLNSFKNSSNDSLKECPEFYTAFFTENLKEFFLIFFHQSNADFFDIFTWILILKFLQRYSWWFAIEYYSCCFRRSTKDWKRYCTIFVRFSYRTVGVGTGCVGRIARLNIGGSCWRMQLRSQEFYLKIKPKNILKTVISIYNN